MGTLRLISELSPDQAISRRLCTRSSVHSIGRRIVHFMRHAVYRSELQPIQIIRYCKTSIQKCCYELILRARVLKCLWNLFRLRMTLRQSGVKLIGDLEENKFDERNGYWNVRKSLITFIFAQTFSG